MIRASHRFSDRRCGRLPLVLVCLGILLARPAASFAQAGPREDATTPTVVVLVRHAEKELTGDDPALKKPEGETRAVLLASTLRDAGVTAIFTTAARRTKDTAALLATALHLTPIEIGKDLTHVREQVVAAGKRVLIVGHSNTVPALIAALGGPSGIEIADNEFDGFYVLTIPPQGPATLLTLRYGAAPSELSNPMSGKVRR